jgi:hypothetical protein
MDTADGLEGGDYSVATVWSGKDNEQVAEWHGHIAPRDFAHVGANLGYWYNIALLVPEDNNMGSTTVDVLYRTIFYPNLFFRERQSPVDPAISTKRIGWHTGNNKGDMVAGLAYEIENWELTGFTIHSKGLVDECRTYAVHLDKRGKDRWGAQSGRFDDRVTTAMIYTQAVGSWQYSTEPLDDSTSSSIQQEHERRWVIEESEAEGIPDNDWMISGGRGQA